MTSYISYADSVAWGEGLSHIEHVSDAQIQFFLDVPLAEIVPDHPMIRNNDGTCEHLCRILYQIKLLRKKEDLVPFTVTYQSKDDFPHCPDIYDGWHRIRAYQYMDFQQIPCYVEKMYGEDD